MVLQNISPMYLIPPRYIELAIILPLLFEILIGQSQVTKWFIDPLANYLI